MYSLDVNVHIVRYIEIVFTYKLVTELKFGDKCKVPDQFRRDSCMGSVIIQVFKSPYGSKREVSEFLRNHPIFFCVLYNVV